MKKQIFIIAFCLAVVLTGTYAFAENISPSDVVVTGNGLYNNSEALISDGYIPAEYTGWTDSACTYWNGTSAYFTLDLGRVYNLSSLTLSVDNNDSYRIDYSLNKSSWGFLTTINSGDGNVSWGMDTFENVPVSATARYLRIFSIGGDNSYSIGELNVAGTATPEPASMILFGIGGLAITAVRNRKKA
ncbi:MAG TPA: discoidin domain-containing protein [Candidatus Omnitrophota bacterium]|nr:discoidin domain-containing protein [Candidatus Omnitrophota bacterium]HPS20992.1 discoidin domain-containing protein [Candidatus Omnitrophota bacterium]